MNPSIVMRTVSFLPLLIAAVVGSFAVSMPQDAQATVVRGGDVYRFEQEAVIARDAYFVGKELYLRGTVQGDLFAAGATVEVDGVTDEDVLVLGGTVVVRGDIGGDVRAAGGEVTIGGTIAEDAVVLAGTVRFTADSFVGENVLVYADTVLLEGVVDGSVEIHAKRIIMQGTVNGSVNVEARESFSITRDAMIGGDLTYSAPREVFLADTVTVEGEVQFTQRPVGGGDMGLTLLLLRIIMAVVTVVLLVILFPKFARSASTRALSDNGLIALKGLILFFAVPLVGIMLLPTVFGILPALIILFGYLFWVLLAIALAPVIAGVLLARALRRESGQFWAWAALGAIIINLVTALGFLGFMLAFLIFLVAFGTIGSLFYHAMWVGRKEQEELAPVTEDVGEAADRSTNEEHAEGTETTEQEEKDKSDR